MYTKQQVAKTIDHAVLKPEYTEIDLAKHAGMCIENGVYSMCVKPCDIKTGKRITGKQWCEGFMRTQFSARCRCHSCESFSGKAGH